MTPSGQLAVAQLDRRGDPRGHRNRRLARQPRHHPFPGQLKIALEQLAEGDLPTAIPKWRPGTGRAGVQRACGGSAHRPRRYALRQKAWRRRGRDRLSPRRPSPGRPTRCGRGALPSGRPGARCCAAVRPAASPKQGGASTRSLRDSRQSTTARNAWNPIPGDSFGPANLSAAFPMVYRGNFPCIEK